MSSWTTQDLSLPAITAEGVVSKEFLNRDPQYMVVEITGVVLDQEGDPLADIPGTITIEDSADGKVFDEVKASGNLTLSSDDTLVFRFDASVETVAAPIRNICRIKSNIASFSKVFVTWSP